MSLGLNLEHYEENGAAFHREKVKNENGEIGRHNIVLVPQLSHPSRVSRSYSIKAKISENVGIFVLALKRKKW